MIPLLLAIVGCLAVGVAYQQIGLRTDRRRHPAMGRIIAGSNLHVLEKGSGTPPVIFEAGIAGSLLGWALVQGQIAEFAHTVSYDRAGLGWSASGRCKPTVDKMTGDLRKLLGHLDLNGPIILVGHSFGGLLARAYAHRWPEQVRGLVLVDPVGHSSWATASEGELRRLQIGVALARRGAWLAELGVVRGALSLLTSGRRWLPQQLSKATAGKGAGTLARLVGEARSLPSWSHAKIRAHWSDPRCFRAMADYLQALPQCAVEVVNLQVPPEVAVTVLSAGTATDEELAERDAWVNASLNGTHMRVADATHWIQIQKPEAVIRAVRSMVALLKNSQRDK